jgi:hypothetical protein
VDALGPGDITNGEAGMPDVPQEPVLSEQELCEVFIRALAAAREKIGLQEWRNQ